MRGKNLMPLQNKERLAYLVSLTLFFSYIELLVPRIVPFFRLGLSNIVILGALSMKMWPFFLLTVFKSLASSLVSGTLFTPFALISMVQSVASGMLMFALFRLDRLCKNRLMGLYGLSVCGAALSAFVQIQLSSIYLGSGTNALLGPMLIFNTLCGAATAWFAYRLGLLDYRAGDDVGKAGVVENELDVGQGSGNSKTLDDVNKVTEIAKAVTILAACASVFFVKSIPVLVAIFIASLVLQKLSKRKILFVPHVALWIFVIVSSVLVPNGKVLFRVLNFNVTQGAMILGVQKALRLSAVSALSQCALSIRPPQNSILGMALANYRHLSDTLRNSEGNIFERIKFALSEK